MVRFLALGGLVGNLSTVLLVAEAEPQATQETAGMATMEAQVIYPTTALVAEPLVDQGTIHPLTASVEAEAFGTMVKAKADNGDN
mgnify:CR=1 FL=1